MEENYKLAEWLAGDLSGAELEAFEKLPEFQTYKKIAEYSSRLEAPAFDETKLYDNVIRGKKKSPQVRTLHQSWWFKIAAVFVVLLGLTYGYKTTIAVTEAAANGQITSFYLPDNSKVVLNSGSEIDYNKWNWDNKRQLELAGEAYFKVAKGKKFEVKTNLGTVTVLGTQFNVKARNKRFDVTCFEGHVKVKYQQQQVIITRGERVSFENGVLLAIPNTDSHQPEWTTNELSFVQENLAGIVAELERKYNCTINHKSAFNSQLFTGTLPADNLDNALKILSSTYNLEYKRESSNKVILELLDVEK